MNINNYANKTPQEIVMQAYADLCELNSEYECLEETLLKSLYHVSVTSVNGIKIIIAGGWFNVVIGEGKVGVTFK